MSNDPNYKLDEIIFNDFYIFNPEEGFVKRPGVSLRKLAKEYGCSYENIRRRLDRYEAFEVYKDIYTKLPTQLATILINKKYDSVKKIQRATDDELLAVKRVGPRWLEVIREVFPYESSDR